MERTPYLVAAFAVLAAGGVAHARDYRDGAYTTLFTMQQAVPNPQMTPGALDPRVTQDNIDSTICVRGYTKTVRPPVSYTEPLKRKMIREYGYTDHRLRDVELDHLVALELGGAPSDPRNLWPEPHNVVGGWGSFAKDKLENRLHYLVCHRRVTLQEAQTAIATDWIDAYHRVIGPNPPTRRHRNGE